MVAPAPPNSKNLMEESLPRLDLSRRITAAVDFAASKHKRAVFVLIVFALTCFLQGIRSLPPTNRDESRFAQATKQMFETGDFVDIRYQDQPRYRKPIGIYWLQAASVGIAKNLGIEKAQERILYYRIPSLLNAIGSVLALYWAALALMRRRYAFLGALAFAGSIILGVEARIATIDASLLLTAVLAQGALARFYLFGDQLTPKQNWRLAAIFWTAIGASVLLKGPVIPTIVLLTAASLCIADRSARWLLRLKFIPGLLWVAAITTPWLIAIYFKTNGEFYQTSVGTDLLGKFTKGAEGHGAPPGYFFLLYWVALFPAAQLTWLAAPYAWKNRVDPAVRFLLAWLLPSWLMFEIVVTKLPHYILPVLPAAALLIALALDRGVQADRHVLRGGWFWPIVSIAIMTALVLMVYKLDGHFGRTFLIFGVLSIALSFAAWRALAGSGTERALVIALLASAALQISAYSTLPRIRSLFIANRLIEAAHSAPCPNPQIASTLHEASVVFLGGTATELVRGAAAADFLGVGGCRVALVDRREEKAFAARANEIGLNYSRIGEVSAINYTDGHRRKYLVLMPADQHAPAANSGG
jgi:4-amino-4-deoxy-L-arabinose transferase-like glycosyltransferase